MFVDAQHRLTQPRIRQLSTHTTRRTEGWTDSSTGNYTRTLIGLSIGLAISLGLAIYKVYATQKRRKTWILFLEDWLLSFAVICELAAILLLWVADKKYGFGAHIWILTAESIKVNPELLFASGILSISTHGLLRFSLLISTRRLYSAMKTLMHRICDGLLFIEICIVIADLLMLILINPKHITVAWNLYVALEYRAKILPVLKSLCLAGLVTDCLILLSPFPLIFKLRKLTWKRKCQLFVIFLFAFSTILASVIRLWEILRLWNKFMDDFFWYYSIFTTFTQVEVILAMFTTCLPTAAFLFEWMYAQKQNTRRARRSLQNLAGALTSKASTLVATLSEESTVNEPSKEPKHEVTEICTVTTNCSDTNIEVQTSTTNLEITQVTTDIQAKEVTFSDQKYQSELHTEEYDDDDDNFFELLVPSDRFFPHATQLGPRPSNEYRNTVTSDVDVNTQGEV